MATPLRITGLGTNMDIDGMVSKLMAARRVPQEKLKQQRQVLLWQQDQYREVNAKVAVLRDKATALRNSGIIVQKATSSAPSAVTATVAGGASNTSYSVAVSALATASAVTSTGRVSGGAATTFAAVTGTGAAAIDTSKNIGDGSAGSLGITAGSITVNGQAFTVDPSKSLDSLMADISTNKAAGVIMTHNDGSKVFSVQSRTTGQESSIALSASGTNLLDVLKLTAGTQTGTGGVKSAQSLATMGTETAVAGADGTSVVSFRVNGVAFSFDATVDSLDSVSKAINASKAGVSAYYDKITDKFAITSRETGDRPVDLQNIKGNFLAAMKLSAPEAVHVGNAAVFTVDNQEMRSQSNSFTLSGTTFNLSATTTSPVTVGVSAETDKAVEAVKSFVEAYNDTMLFIGGKLSEKSDRSFQPLTDAQRKEMKDPEIKAWEDKAKTGLLRGDTKLRALMTSLTGLVGTSVPSVNTTYNTLAKVGVTGGSTSGYRDLVNGTKLTVDETKLKTALAADSDAVSKLFDYDGGGSTSVQSMGMSRRVRSSMVDLDKYILGQVGSAGTASTGTIIGDKVTNADKAIAALQVKLDKYESVQYAKFSQMESFMNKMNSQSSMFSSMSTGN